MANLDFRQSFHPSPAFLETTCHAFGNFCRPALLSRDITTLSKSSSAGTDGWTLHLSWLQHSAHFHQLFPLDELHGHEHHLQVLKHIQGSHTADLSHGSHFIEIVHFVRIKIVCLRAQREWKCHNH